MAAKSGSGVKIFILLVVLAAAGWLIWKSMPPYSQGTHDAVAEAKTNAPGSGPKIGNCQMLPADNIWNTPIDKLKKAAKSDAYIANIGPMAKLHPDFASNLAVGIPFSDIPPGTKKVRITFDYADESDLGNYPIPANAPLEGGLQASNNGDRHIILIDQQRCLLYEIWAAYAQPDGTWKAGSGEKWDLTSNALRDEGRGSADAAGLEVLPGLVRYDEVASGEIDHALRFTTPHTQAAYLWPARHKASKITDTDVPPMGVRLRLRQDFDISGYSKTNQVILTAMKRYGMFLADNGGAMFFTGVPDKRWDDEDLHKLTGVTASDFEAVDESDLQLLADSARVDPVALAAVNGK
jgi:hypothetical protein